MSQVDFTENLKFLSGYYRSVADVCRRIGINRQQFNKYLSGLSMPSRHTMRRICDFFGVEEYEILLPPDEFRDLVALRPRSMGGEGKLAGDVPPYVAQMETLFETSKNEVGRYLGYYFSYRFSFSEPNLVLKSVIHFWKEDERVLSKRVERFIESYGDVERSFLCKYVGYLVFLRDRIYIVENEMLANEEVSETILYPGYRNHVTWLSGLNLGVSTSDDRRIGCGRVLYQYLGREIDLVRALKASGKHDLDSAEVPAIVREQLAPENHGGKEPFIFALPR